LVDETIPGTRFIPFYEDDILLLFLLMVAFYSLSTIFRGGGGLAAHVLYTSHTGGQKVQAVN
jgi:hypothetical protein